MLDWFGRRRRRFDDAVGVRSSFGRTRGCLWETLKQSACAASGRPVVTLTPKAVTMAFADRFTDEH